MHLCKCTCAFISDFTLIERRDQWSMIPEHSETSTLAREFHLTDLNLQYGPLGRKDNQFYAVVIIHLIAEKIQKRQQ